MNDKSKARYKRYDEAFKREAVEHWMVSGMSGRQIAAELGINEQSLKIWKQRFKQLPTGQKVYQVRALNSVITGSGSYTNIRRAVFSTAN